MDSTQDQATMQSTTTEQPDVTKSDEASMQSQTFEVNWQQLTADKLLENYTKLQAEYTKSRQELSKTKKESELSPEDKAAIDFIKNNWFVTKDELEKMSIRASQEAKLWDIIASNPDLRPFESAIRELWKNWEMAYEDIIQKYGFKSKDKLAKAREQWDIKWGTEPKKKSISEMSMEEYEKYRQEIWIGRGGSFS